PSKAWPAERFADIADHLHVGGLEPVFLAGPADDPSPFAKYSAVRNAGLDRVKSLISGASLFVGNDSGPAHIAAAFGVPVVALFGPSNPVTWSPWRTESQVLVSKGPIETISVEQVATAVDALRVRA